MGVTGTLDGRDGVGVGHILAQRVSVRDGDRSVVEVGNEMLMRPLCQSESGWRSLNCLPYHVRYVLHSDLYLLSCEDPVYITLKDIPTPFDFGDK